MVFATYQRIRANGTSWAGTSHKPVGYVRDLWDFQLYICFLCLGE